jgi:hypothetical protein
MAKSLTFLCSLCSHHRSDFGPPPLPSVYLRTLSLFVDARCFYCVASPVWFAAPCSIYSNLRVCTLSWLICCSLGNYEPQFQFVAILSSLNHTSFPLSLPCFSFEGKRIGLAKGEKKTRSAWEEREERGRDKNEALNKIHASQLVNLYVNRTDTEKRATWPEWELVVLPAL